MNAIDSIIMRDLDYFKNSIESVSDNIVISKTSRKSFQHIKSRLIERNIHNLDLKELIYDFDNHVEEFLDYVNLEYDVRPFKINIKNDKLIIVTSRVDDYKWKINTVLDPKKHNLHSDEVNNVFEKTIEIGHKV